MMDVKRPLSYFMPFAQKNFKFDSSKNQYTLHIREGHKWRLLPTVKSFADLDLSLDTELVMSDKNTTLPEDIALNMDVDGQKPIIKLSSNLIYDKKKRYVVVDGDILIVHKSQDDTSEASESLYLPDFCIGFNEKEKKEKLVLDISSVKSKKDFHQIKFNSEEEAALWHESLDLVCSKEQPASSGSISPRGAPPPSNQVLYFGGTLETALQGGRLIPYVVEHCIQILKERALDVEGLFRLSGSQIQIDKYKAEFNSGVSVDLSKELDVHTISGLLKLYFRDMAEPLLTFKLYDPLISALNEKDRNKRAKLMHRLVYSLPKERKATLKYLVEFLRLVVDHADVNKMAIHNIATVFAPNLIKAKNDNMLQIVQDTPLVNSVLSTFIEDYDIVFSDDPPSDGVLDTAKVIYDYEAKEKNELSLKKGEVVKVIQQLEKGWWFGELNGKTGLFPGSYVELQTTNKKQQFMLELEAVKSRIEENKKAIVELQSQKQRITEELSQLDATKENAFSESKILKSNILAIIDSFPELSTVRSDLDAACQQFEANHKSKSSLFTSKQGLLEELALLKKTLLTSEKFKKCKDKLVPLIDTLVVQFEEEQKARNVVDKEREQIFRDLTLLGLAIAPKKK